ncbi:hypothetical protein ACT497_001238 [Salmonella enterica subsp. enterica serovar Glostrup]|nr:hypothetical protein [Salmonella enterica]HCL4760390.1 hypothetical protein [Salmonella enterica]
MDSNNERQAVKPFFWLAVFSFLASANQPAAQLRYNSFAGLYDVVK